MRDFDCDIELRMREIEEKLGKRILVTLFDIMGTPVVHAVQWRGNNLMKIIDLFPTSVNDYRMIENQGIILTIGDKDILLRLYDYIVLDINKEPEKYICGMNDEKSRDAMVTRIRSNETKKAKYKLGAGKPISGEVDSSKINDYFMPMEKTKAVQWTGDNHGEVIKFLKQSLDNLNILYELMSGDIVLFHSESDYEFARINKGCYLTYSSETGFKVYSHGNFKSKFKPV